MLVFVSVSRFGSVFVCMRREMGGSGRPSRPFGSGGVHCGTRVNWHLVGLPRTIWHWFVMWFVDGLFPSSVLGNNTLCPASSIGIYQIWTRPRIVLLREFPPAVATL